MLPALLVSAALVLQIARADVAVLGAGWARFDPTRWPDEKNDVTAHLKILPEGTHVFNELNFGGFLMYHAPNVRIFVDDRCELYGQQFLLEYIEADEKPALVDTWAERYNFRFALTQRGSPIDLYLAQPEHGWQLLRECTAARLYARESEMQPRIHTDEHR